MRNVCTCPWAHSWTFMPPWDKTEIKRNQRRRYRGGKRRARQASAVFPPRRRCLGRRVTERMDIPPGAEKPELLYPEMFSKVPEPRKRRRREGVEESLSVRGIAPTQILSELTIKERRGIQTWLRAPLETGTTTGHFLLLTFIRFISGLPKRSERRGR